MLSLVDEAARHGAAGGDELKRMTSDGWQTGVGEGSEVNYRRASNLEIVFLYCVYSDVKLWILFGCWSGVVRSGPRWTGR